MTQKEERQIEKSLIDTINNTTPGSADHKTAMDELLKFKSTCEEIRKNKASEELEKAKIGSDQTKYDVERQKIESQETVNKCQRDLEEKKLQQEKDLAAGNREIEERKLRADKLARRWNAIGNIVSVLGGIVGGITTTVVGYKLYDKQATKAYKFEETGTISSFTSRQILGNMKPPKK